MSPDGKRGKQEEGKKNRTVREVSPVENEIFSFALTYRNTKTHTQT
jgi:hypothetical protein